MARRRRTTRGRSAHPGVVLSERRYASGRTAWRARHKDPVTGKTIYTVLDPLGLTTAAARKDWACRLSRRLRERKAAIASGHRPVEALTIEQAVERYFKTARATLSPQTIEGYGSALRRFVAWAAAEGVQRPDQLTGPALARFRDVLVSLPRKRAYRGGKSGAPRSPVSVNSDTRAVKTVLGHWRRWGLTPEVDRDTLSDTLAPFPVPKKRPAFLRAEEIQRLLEAAKRHDAACYELTRAEHRGEATPGQTPRHEPIMPLLVFTLLTGCRIGEVLALRWSSVDLQAHGGAGEIIVHAETTKTRTERAVHLDVSPSLRGLLASLRVRLAPAEHVFTRRDGAAPTRTWIERARRRLIAEYGAPEFDWQRLRQTTSTFLTNAPGIYGGASVWLSAKRLGHSVQVAESRYVGLVTVPAGATTLEEAMGVEAQIASTVVDGQLTNQMAS